MAEWECAPGRSFEPPDIHSGDEVYYITEGELIVENPNTGQVVQAKEGDCIHILLKTYHKPYNFTDKKTNLICMAQGILWKENDFDEVEEISDHKLKIVRYKGCNEETMEDMVGLTKNIENKNENRLVHITPERTLKVIHGTESLTKFNFYVSNERIHVGKFVICQGDYSSYEIHKGDEALYVLKGSVQIEIPSELEDKDAVSRTVYMVKEGQKFFIPLGIKHQYSNYRHGMCEVLFVISPKL